MEEHPDSSEYELGTQFQMQIKDVFSILGRGTVVTGLIENGTIYIGDKVEIPTKNGKVKTSVVGIQIFHDSQKSMDYAQAGDEVGLLLNDVKYNEVEVGGFITNPTSF